MLLYPAIINTGVALFQQGFVFSIFYFNAVERADPELVAKLNHERELELEASKPDAPDPSIQEFLKDSPWTVVDRPGTHDVIFSRDFGNEKSVLVTSNSHPLDMLTSF
jgi:hypothetical protein